jgi:inosose dehydratase
MTPRLTIAGAPITWGVCEVPGWGRQLDSHRVLAEIARAGLAATELGPRGFLPDEPAETRARLAAHGLRLVAGFVPAILHRANLLEEQLAAVERSARTLAGAGAEVLVLAAETGDAGYEASQELDDEQWSTLARATDEAGVIARRAALTLAFHPHYGTVIERAPEIWRLLGMSRVSLCLDTGHLVVAGANPVDITRFARERISHVHLKDVDARLATRVRSGEIGYRDAVARGLYRALGDGDVDLVTIVRLLESIGYDGWYVLEQDTVLEAGDDASTLLDRASRSVRHLTQLAARSAA